MASEPKQQTPINVDDSKAVSCYANFCRVTGSPEELIVDFGMNAQPMGSNDQPVDIKQRNRAQFFIPQNDCCTHCMCRFNDMKKFLDRLKTDIQKRVKPQSKCGFIVFAAGLGFGCNQWFCDESFWLFCCDDFHDEVCADFALTQIQSTAHAL